MLETILVIDDDADAAQSLALTLESKNYLVFSAGGEDTSLVMARKVNPRLIFVNPSVAGGKGLEICKRIHATEQLKNVPIIVLSAYEGARDPHFAALYGIVDSLPKPFSPEDLFARTEHALSLTLSNVRPVDAQPVVDTETPQEIEPEETAKMTVTPITGEEQSLPFPDPPVSMPEPEKEFTKGRDNTYPAKRTMRGSRHKTRLPAALIAAVAVIMLGAVGFIFYNRSSGTHEAAPAKSVAKPPQEAASVNPPVSAQTPQADVKNEPPSKPEAVRTPPPSAKAAAKPEVTASPQAAASDTRTISKVSDEPKKEPRSATEVTTKTVYSVQIGVFKSQKNASAMARQYEGKGYEAFTHRTSSADKKVLYRVLIGRFAGRREAAVMAKKINSEEHIPTMVFKR